MHRSLWAGSLAVCLLVAGCSASVHVGSSTPQVSKTDLASKAKDALTKAVGETPRSLTCPSDLNAKVGASERCSLTDNAGNTFGLTVTLSAFNKGTGKYTLDVKVDNAPSSSSTNTPSG